MNVKRQILFVDDESNVLAAIRRSMRSMRDAWELSFAQSGHEALGMMRAKTFHVIITDIRMPGMNGVDLLTEVKRLYPDVVRIILSGHTDEALAIKSTELVHQFLAKPCEPEVLRSAIERSCSARNKLNDPGLARVISQISALPSVPLLYQKIVDELADPDASVNYIGQIIAQDAAMTACVLHLSNSAFFGLPRKITSPVEAARMLGVNTLKALVLTVHIFDQCDPIEVEGFSMAAEKDHNLQTSLYTSRIAQLATQNRNTASEATIAALLHDVGKLILAQHFPEPYGEALTRARESHVPVWKVEREIIGATHPQIGAYLLGLWGLPNEIIEATAFHHEPLKSQNRSLNALTMVHVANAFARAHDLAAGEAIQDIDRAYLEELGLADQIPVWREVCSKVTERREAA